MEEWGKNMKCKVCGIDIDKNWNYCPNCHNKISVNKIKNEKLTIVTFITTFLIFFLILYFICMSLYLLYGCSGFSS